MRNMDRKTYKMLLEELKVLEVKKAALAKEINEASAMVLVSKIERPKEQSIREGMGLAGNKAKYDAIRVRSQLNLAMEKKNLGVSSVL